MGKALLTATNLSPFHQLGNDADRIAVASRKYSPAWTNFLRDLVVIPKLSRPNALQVFCKSSPINDLEKSVSGHWPHDIYEPPIEKEFILPIEK